MPAKPSSGVCRRGSLQLEPVDNFTNYMLPARRGACSKASRGPAIRNGGSRSARRTWCSGSRSSRLRFFNASASSSTLDSCIQGRAVVQCSSAMC